MASEIFAAIRSGDRAAVERLVGADPALVDTRDEDGLSPILAALYRGRSDIASTILARGPRLTVFEAAAAGALDRVRELVDHEPALANATAPDGYSPLGLAAFFKRREVVRYLVAKGADVDRASRDQGLHPAALGRRDGCGRGGRRDRASPPRRRRGPERPQPPGRHAAPHRGVHR
jgi:ankyrin repeat protein